MTQQNGIDEWIEVTEYFRYIEDMIERNFKQNYGISLREFYVLYELYKAKDKKYKINDLIKEVKLSQSAMSRLIDRLRSPKKAFICKDMSKEDQRATYIYLTEKGNNIIQALMSDYRKLIGKVNIEDIEMLVRKVKDANPS
ncbi:MarR family winged helix-turn-helix transcriptional regulator [Staphylococcus caprae]|uniref:MarR family winged helix-turn-helix transcriptional regulator n=1 Tax=Staphylococcus caprae TaxID=29380 RepID=UPI000E683770|nr:winged helix DNA-binding protein [Staphylococcus caprae]MBU5272509.1 winged helix DNA-binding protein [Staphylococcus caprae]MDK6298245.1 winged helix DNA-binding protein [Staphylococcus caprae]MDK7232323.1 winged helix DNA-binding protein [Staphylococcus caprae]RIM35329.1 MarR family transcriptional regulator [Staphylococcus caprae]